MKEKCKECKGSGVLPNYGYQTGRGSGVHKCSWCDGAGFTKQRTGVRE